MNERKKLISQSCPQYNTQVEFLMETSLDVGRTLIARYEIGGPDDLPMVDGRREFRAGIPDGVPSATKPATPLASPALTLHPRVCSFCRQCDQRGTTGRRRSNKFCTV